MSSGLPSTAGAFSTMRSKYVATSICALLEQVPVGFVGDLAARLERVGIGGDRVDVSPRPRRDRAPLDADVVRLAEQQLRAASPCAKPSASSNAPMPTNNGLEMTPP